MSQRTLKGFYDRNGEKYDLPQGGGGGSVDVSGKADKVDDATSGNLASLDAEGNLQDSYIAAANVIRKNSNGCVSEGTGTTASEVHSHAEGYRSAATSFAAHAEGTDTQASASHAHAEGYETRAAGNSSHAEGQETVASGSQSHAEGFNSSAIAKASHAEGYCARAEGEASHAEGISIYPVKGTEKTVKISFLGNNPLVVNGKNYYYLVYPNGESGWQAGIPDLLHGCTLKFTPEGGGNQQSRIVNSTIVTATGGADDAIAFSAEPYDVLNTYLAGATDKDSAKPVTIEYPDRYGKASGVASHAEGYDTIASGNYSHAEGEFTNATGRGSHAEGNGSTASGDYSHAGGSGAEASGKYSIAHGSSNAKALGDYAVAIGAQVFAEKDYSFVCGANSSAKSDYEFVIGKSATTFNPNDNNGLKRLFAIGNGGAMPKNAIAIYSDNTVDGEAVENSVPIQGEKKLITSGAVYEAINAGVLPDSYKFVVSNGNLTLLNGEDYSTLFNPGSSVHMIKFGFYDEDDDETTDFIGYVEHSGLSRSVIHVAGMKIELLSQNDVVSIGEIKRFSSFLS